MAVDTQSRDARQGVRAATLAAAILGFAVAQLDVFVVNVA